MVFKPRTLLLVMTAGFGVSAAFAFDAARQQLWANAIIGVGCCLLLLVLIWARDKTPQYQAAGPIIFQPDASRDVSVLLDQIPTPLLRWIEGEARPEALNKAARVLFETDDLVIGFEPALDAAFDRTGQALQPLLTVKGRHYSVRVSETVLDDAVVRLAAITDVQGEMSRVEAAALKDTLHVLSHEIMNSLTPVSSLADIANSYLVTEEGADIPAAREALGMLSRRADSLTRFIEAYRSVAGLPEPILQSASPQRLVQDILSPFIRSERAHGVDFELSVEEPLPRLMVDEAQFGQAIINVVTNALEATLGQADRRVGIRVHANLHDVLIEISDNGPGVPEPMRANLFTAFVTTKTKGTGTGLNLARQIALAHGGNLYLDDEKAMTTFVFRFSVAET